MQQLRTEDPKLAVHHIIGCWSANQGCSGIRSGSPVPALQQPPIQAEPATEVDDEFTEVCDWSK
ncbi:MAG: hypothetical protein F6K04_02355 [Leptolyngbya sp. SIO4C5]|nr:hypothetical protein [Leptolyngbya sp. SIO4C5]